MDYYKVWQGLEVVIRRMKLRIAVTRARNALWLDVLSV
jgi:hypothetical protein